MLKFFCRPPLGNPAATAPTARLVSAALPAALRLLPPLLPLASNLLVKLVM